MDKTETVFWRSDTHHGSITYYDADGVLVDFCFWADATDTKSGQSDHALPYASLDEALKRLAKKYGPVSIVSERDTQNER